ncbi:MAG: hypothetical protein RBS48_02140 [Ignavibacteriaceae bacterium]|jgi:hypothetical protein|nr:hypothetical protein [Ignavibacteriaceae bacterium]
MKKIFFIILITPMFLNAQFMNPSIGAYAGIGEMKGNSPSLSVYSLNGYIGFYAWFSADIEFRTGFFYAQKIENLIPENRAGKFYPFIKGYYLSANISQFFNDTFFLEEGVGIIIINDRIYNDRASWDIGAKAHLAAGFRLKQNLRISGGIDFASTVTNTSASYLIYMVQTQYYF